MKVTRTALPVLISLVVGTPMPTLADAPATWEKALERAGDHGPELRRFIDQAAERHGELGQRASQFLVAGMPAADLRSLDADFLGENLDLALKAREVFPWAREVPEAVFFNDVLPYACLDETREGWRPKFFELAAPIVEDCRTATAAAQALNQKFFDEIGVHYDTRRRKPNQSPSESIELGMASCTGLSILLVDACRAVGVPARVAGTALWTNKRGNHTWVEIYDRGQWFFTGADEYDPQGLNRGWFTKDAARAKAEDWRHAIWASSWAATGHHFPMVWDLGNREVPAVHVTARYTSSEAASSDSQVATHFRARATRSGQRIVAEIEHLAADGAVIERVQTRAGRADLNDMATLHLPADAMQTLRIRHEGQSFVHTLTVEGETTVELVLDELEICPAPIAEALEAWLSSPPEARAESAPEIDLTAADAAAAATSIFDKLAAEARQARADELGENRIVKAAGREMKLLERRFGQAPPEGPSLWISMHGGGGAPAGVNDRQWRNQIRLYQPKEGIYVAPRAPTNTWNLWHEAHMDDLLDRLIENYLLSDGIDPDRVYLLGYSAGGDGVYQLAPRMADRFAAASMMAGHPNDASPLGLRNLPFMIWMGGKDRAYDRNKVARKWGDQLDALAKDGGYPHQTHILPDKGHWMDREDAAALPWMAAHTRNPWPKTVVWHQSPRTHTRFYWLAVAPDEARKGRTIRASVEGQRIDLTSDAPGPIRLRLSDQLLDLDKDVTVVRDGKEVFQGRVTRSVGAIYRSLTERLDPKSVATAELVIQ